MSRIFLLFLVFTLIFFPLATAQAQTETNNPVYIVQSGDTLNIIAQKFGVPVKDLINANNITDPNSLAVGERLIIPGLDGVSGVLSADVVPFGYNLRALSIGYQIPEPLLSKLNRVTSPSEIFAGANLILPQTSDQNKLDPIGQINSGESLLEAAMVAKLNPWSLSAANEMSNLWDVVPGESIFYYPQQDNAIVSASTSLVTKIEALPLPLVQGSTIVIRVYTRGPANVTGKLGSSDLIFHPEKDNQFVAIQGIYALANPGLSQLQIRAVNDLGEIYQTEESLLLKAGNYPQDPTLEVDPKTIDPAVTKPEEDLVANSTKPSTETKFWSGKFHLPVDQPICIKSGYGNRRSYNNGPYIYFHTGLDFGVCANLNIYAAAPGKVVFAGPLTVRGNATIIDHGWGIYTGYYHQAKIEVKVGDMVQAGQLIGQIGATGRVTGPHLHFDLFVNSIQVDPHEWLDNAFP
jgi:murein DD-endopeptidase MepM/ murein hydrolase activator NlpD